MIKKYQVTPFQTQFQSRLTEFEQTDSGKLSKTTFETINLDESANPPSFAPPNKKHKTDQYQPQEIENLSHDIKENISFLMTFRVSYFDPEEI